MEITEVRIKLMDGGEDRLRGFCSITFDHCFVVRDLKIIDGNTGLFIAMPSRKLTFHCPRCRTKNNLRSRFCNQCGSRLPAPRVDAGPDGRGKLYSDVAHPINAACRETIQRRIIEEYHHEVELARQPGYRSRYDDDYEAAHEERSQANGRALRFDEGQPPGEGEPHPPVVSAPDATLPPAALSGKEKVDQD